MPAARPRKQLSTCWANSRVGAQDAHTGRAARPVEELLNDGQQERGRLAGAGLGDADDVVAGADERDGLVLDGVGLV